MTRHFDGNSKTRGRPPTDSNDMNIINFINVLSSFGIKVWLTDDILYSLMTYTTVSINTGYTKNYMIPRISPVDGSISIHLVLLADK